MSDRNKSANNFNGAGKVFSELEPLIKCDYTIMHDNSILCKLKASKKIKLSQNFFRADGCSNCGRCCKHFGGHIFTESEYQNILSNKTGYCKPAPELYGDKVYWEEIIELLDSLRPVNLVINGKHIRIYQETLPGNADILVKRKWKLGEGGTIFVPSCHWTKRLEDGSIVCTIHPVRSLSCRLPHIRFKTNKSNDTSYVTCEQFGRNWSLGCPIQLTSTMESKSIQDNIAKLEYTLMVANDLGLDTYLEELIEKAKEQLNRLLTK